MMFSKLFVVVDLCRREGCCGDGTVLEKLTRQCYHIRANHQCIGRLTNLRIANLRLERQSLLAYGDINNQCVAYHASFHLLGVYCRFLADTVMLDE